MDFQLTSMTSEIWDKYASGLKKFIRKRVRNEHDAEDILQDVFCKIHDNFYKLQNVHKLQAWIYQIARNAVNDYFRYRKVMTGMSDIPPQTAEGGYAGSINDESNGPCSVPYICLKPMIDHLPDKYREAVILFYFEGLKNREIADKLGLSLPAAKSRLQRGREKLRELLLDCCQFELDKYGNVLDYRFKSGDRHYCSE
ncbi:RNA polymerase, sigma-24 subunit, ECF subfamily [Thermincola potens JR]|uniref:RNA polymerase sigma factor SigZ n=2 Tax=Thermincola TaxID=278993 RepID=D5XB27_THEPJ|nr:RNA polymerase, sigma-24 subunit, ECF subfamily [Thermincola potens JR]